MDATDDTVGLEAPQDFAEGRSADAVELRQLRLGRQPIADRRPPVRDLGKQLVADLSEQRHSRPDRCRTVLHGL
jgi:hypothetical protein